MQRRELTGTENAMIHPSIYVVQSESTILGAIGTGTALGSSLCRVRIIRFPLDRESSV